MTRDEDRERMNAEIDGENTESGTRKLHRWLEGDPSRRAEFEDLHALTGALDRAPDLEPPPHLFHRILAAIPFGRYPAATARPRTGWRAWWAKHLPRPQLRYASTFALGLVVGAILLWAAGRGPENGTGEGALDISTLYGTMNTIDTTDGFQLLDRVGVNLAQVHGGIQLHESDHTLLADVSLTSEEPIEWVIHYDEADVSFEGFRRVTGGGTLSAASTHMQVKQQGDGRFLLFFAEKEGARAPMGFEIFSDGELLYEGALGKRPAD